MKRKYLWNVGVLFVAIGLVHCNAPKQVPSNLPVENIDAEKVISVRLKKTQEVRRHIRSVLDSLSTVEGHLKTALYEIDLKANLEEGHKERVVRVFKRLREHLQGVADKMVRYRDDGSWVISRRVDLPYSSQTARFRHAEFSIIGSRVESGDRMTLNLEDLDTRENLVLATATVSGKKLELHYDPAAIDDLVYRDFKLDACRLSSEPHSMVLHCEPFELLGTDLSYESRRLDLSIVSGLTDLSLDATLRAFRRYVADIGVEVHPGLPKQIRIFIQENP